MKIRLTLFIILLNTINVFAQHPNSKIRNGNTAYKDSAYSDAEQLYREALMKNQNSNDYVFNSLEVDRIDNNKDKFIKKNKDELGKLANDLFGVKDLIIENFDGFKNDVVIVSSLDYFEKEDCYKIGVMQSKFSQIEITFNTIFLNDECTASAYAGKMINYIFNNKSGILLSIDALSKKKDQAQNIKSNLGKILFLNLDNYSFTQFSKGHRNPQGLYNDDGVIISTEHGPRGGDEINIIKENKNYGWPISSYGEPYNFEKSDKTKYNYLKNHKKNGFEEPVFSFVPSIGISQLIKIPEGFNEFWKNNYLITSLNSGSIYRTKINLLDNKLNFIEKIFIGERIRDIIYIKNLKIILLALENTGSIGVLSNFIEN